MGDGMHTTTAENGHDLSGDAKEIPPARLALILGLLGISYLFNAMDRQMLPALLPQINADYHISLAQGAALSTSFAITIGIVGGSAGWIMKRLGRRITLIAGILIYSTFTFVTPLAISYGNLVFYRALTGAGEAMQICALFSTIGAYFGSRRGTAMGFINALFGVGAFLGPVIGTLIYSSTGSWRMPFYIYGLAGIGIAALLTFTVPREFSEAEDCEGALGSSIAEGVGPSAVFNRNLIVLLISFSMIGIPFFSFTSLYAVFLRTQLHYTTDAAAATLGLYGVGSLFALVGGWLGERLRTRGMLVATLLLAVVGHLLFHGPQTKAGQGALALIFGMLVSGYLYPRFIATMQRNVPAKDVALAVSIGLPLFYLPGMGAGYAFGRLVEQLGWSPAATLTLTMHPAIAILILMGYQPKLSREIVRP
jgi:predicted MFS family arabinose efflux permease